MTIRIAVFAAVLGALGLGATAHLTPARAQVHENVNQVKTLNAFAESLLAIHRHWAETRNIKESTRTGGYHRMPDFYREVEHRDTKTGLLLSRVKWEREIPENLHSIDVFFYDEKGRVTVDYTATYLTDFRNAPIQALVNLHHYDGDLWAFRQFDTSGDRTFERCEGTYFSETVEMWLNEEDIIVPPDDLRQDFYTACFGYLPMEAGNHLRPETLVPGLKMAGKIPNPDDMDSEQAEKRIVQLGMQITVSPKSAALYLKRGNTFFLLHRFDEAIADFSRAIKLDDQLDKAYFSRGMALGRVEKLDQAIADLSIFIQRHPDNSVAYTKRGVRHIWNRDFKNAEKDLTKAVELNESNAEAHDDLGVVLAQDGRLEKAIEHFLKAKAIDPSYQKVHHNLAMSYFILNDLDRALSAVDDALKLKANTRSALILKGQILESMGKTEKARTIRERAEFLPEDANRSERSTLR